MAGMTLAEYRAAAAAIPGKTRKSQRKDQRTSNVRAIADGKAETVTVSPEYHADGTTLEIASTRTAYVALVKALDLQGIVEVCTADFAAATGEVIIAVMDAE